MTPEEINKAIAEKVMGYTDIYFSSNFRVNGVKQMFAKIEASDDCRNGVGNFSGDIQHAWQVVEKMKEKGWLHMVAAAQVRGDYCMFSNGHTSHSVTSGTASMAICLAALKALS